MSRSLTAADRSALIRLASTMPAGSTERRAILAGLSRAAMEFDTQEALDKYLKEHPGADKSKHKLKKQEGGKKPEDKGSGGSNHMNKMTSKDLEQHVSGVYESALKDPSFKALMDKARKVYGKNPDREADAVEKVTDNLIRRMGEDDFYKLDQKKQDAIRDQLWNVVDSALS